MCILLTPYRCLMYIPGMRILTPYFRTRMRFLVQAYVRIGIWRTFFWHPTDILCIFFVCVFSVYSLCVYFPYFFCMRILRDYSLYVYASWVVSYRDLMYILCMCIRTPYLITHMRFLVEAYIKIGNWCAFFWHSTDSVCIFFVCLSYIYSLYVNSSWIFFVRVFFVYVLRTCLLTPYTPATPAPRSRRARQTRLGEGRHCQIRLAQNWREIRPIQQARRRYEGGGSNGSWWFWSTLEKS